MLTLVVNRSPLCQYARLSSGKLNLERGPGLGRREVSVAKPGIAASSRGFSSWGATSLFFDAF